MRGWAQENKGKRKKKRKNLDCCVIISWGGEAHGFGDREKTISITGYRPSNITKSWKTFAKRAKISNYHDAVRFTKLQRAGVQPKLNMGSMRIRDTTKKKSKLQRTNLRLYKTSALWISNRKNIKFIITKAGDFQTRAKGKKERKLKKHKFASANNSRMHIRGRNMA